METTIQDTKPFDSKEHFQKYRAVFKKLAHKKRLTATDMIIHNVLRGRKPDYGFGRITNPIKLANGGHQSKFFLVCWNLWNNIRIYNNNKKLSPDYAEKIKIGIIGNYESKEIFTEKILDHIFNVLQK